MSDPALTIRPATSADAEIIAEYNLLLAAETEDKVLDRETLLRGVRALLEDESKGRYFVACEGERVIGQVMHTREWSDWRNGDLWWLQSVYVHADYRGRGVFRSLFEHLRGAAEADPNVVGLRLYVEQHNARAKTAYRSLQMEPGGYEVMERLWR